MLPGMAEASASNRPIGVFDSGLGGLTVVRQILRLMPAEDVVYLGDSARVPYGIKSPETIRQFALEDVAFLRRFGPKIVVVACNTASAVALEELRRAAPVEVVGVVEPAAQEAVALAKGGKIGVIGTEATIASGAYQRAICSFNGTGEVLAAQAPLLVPIVEEGWPDDDPIVLYVLSRYMNHMQRQRPAVLILGCTHYPLLACAIGKLMGPSTQLLDPGEAVARRVQALLGKAGLQRQPQAGYTLGEAGSAGQGSLRCFSTDNPQRFGDLAMRFLGRPVGTVQRIGTDELAQRK
jgi:glutamate racemase